MAIRKDGFARAAGVDPQKLLAAIQRGVREDAASRRPRSIPRTAYVFASLAAAFLVVFLIRKPEPREVPGDGVREKGGLALRVYKLAGGRSQRVASGDRFSAGDRLAFVADLPAAGHVNVLGVEASGAIYVAWPTAASEPTLRRAGRLQELPGAVELDGSQGRETFYLVHCPAAVGSPATVCQVTHVDGVGVPPRCPESCALAPFVLDKNRSGE